MDDDLFTYEVEISGITNIPCELKEEDDSEQLMSHATNEDIKYDPSNVELLNGDDEVELTDEESSNSDDEDEVAKIFRIDTNV
ncbi:hypothetical protein Tco_0721160, partial [Tanacetum coccineum]